MTLRISVIGTGYLGATHAACLAELGFDVLGVDRSAAKVDALSRGLVPFHEPGLDELVAGHTASGRLRFTTDLAEAAAFADVHFICVGTPQQSQGTAADLTAVFDVAAGLAPHLRHSTVVIGKSTVPVGTAAELAATLRARLPLGVEAEVAWNPEFLREGHAVQDTLRPDRLVFGVTSPGAELVLREIYAAAIERGTPVHVTDLATAELAKVAANAFLATKISFINAMAEISDRAGADVVALADVLGDDARIGRRFLDAGIGFGGGCLPKDIRALAARAAELGAPSIRALLEDVDDINLRARDRAADLAAAMCGGDLDGRRVALLGAAFKPLSDDVRDSPALHVAAALRRRGADVRVFDPAAANNARAVAPELTYVAHVDAALHDADLVVLATDWPELVALDPGRAGALVRSRRILDGRNKLDEEAWTAAGWAFRALGRAAAPVATAPVAPAPAPTPAPTPAPRRPGRLRSRAAALLR
ncbi:UDP-glucose dehydrogenase family protein [Nocardioides pocheonensis]|uniref:UDP-glucose 6-dehydrogenase n=1 Tax=Nocardioides pocheonensis TaxID=661485 RepID=A0A3N0GUF3_9ACTN|nr:UDP-glucose/GDP-mannose dehydrogenase family protein [Nocardioides pocheonensis]RNM15788.1 UDP-glucose/GDP-mannose dehydrogenase family protein [Nocardioides pocheonensis]